MSLLDRFFKPSYEHDLKNATPLVTLINQAEVSLRDRAIGELREMSDSLRARAQRGESLDDLLVEAFALIREVARQTLRQRHHDVQLIGGIMLHRGKIAEMRTGEGKTLVATLPAYLNALRGTGVHIVTVNDYLARRDAVWMGQIYAALGITVGIINQDGSYVYDATHTEADATRDRVGAYEVRYEFLRPVSRVEAYAADITYGTNNEFGFDYLRDNIEFEVSAIRQRGHAYALIDEVDSILIDEARTPLIISAPAQETENLYEQFARIAAELSPETDYIVDEKLKSATLTDAGIARVESMLGVDNIYTDKGILHVHHLETAVRAHALYNRDKEYVVRDNEVVIVDEFTGRLQPGRRWSDGLHQAVEAKENVTIQRESKTYASITFQNYFRLYTKLAGMTGTALTSQEEFYSVYKLDVVPVPTHHPVARIDHNDLIFQTEAGKIRAIVARVAALYEKGQPVLIGTASIEKNQLMSTALTNAGIPHEVLNAKNHEQEGSIIAKAGMRGRVTLATNMAGRGVDIKLGGVDATEESVQEIKSLGGLFVLGTERHEARRIDNQLRGRSGRQGDPGETQFFVSMDDTLMRVFGGDTVKGMMGRLGIPEDQPIENGMITRSLESAQKKIEGFHFDARKQVLAYDNVLNQQRELMYAKRRMLLLGSVADVEDVFMELTNENTEARTLYDTHKAQHDLLEWEYMIRKLMLHIIDTVWIEHLDVMQHTRSSVSLRAYGQQDPLLEYRKEAIRLFAEMNNAIGERILRALPTIRPATIAKEEAQFRKQQAHIERSDRGDAHSGARVQNEPVVRESRIGRNEMVTITDGRSVKTVKYKKAEDEIASGVWRIVAKENTVSS